MFARTSQPFHTRRNSPRPKGGEDLIGLVGFHDQGFVMAKPTSAFSPWLQERTSGLHGKIAGSGTNLAAGLRVALHLVVRAPQGMHRRIWLLSDGYPNREVEGIAPAVAEAVSAWTNINTIGFGDSFDEGLLREIAAGTHHGKFVSVQSLRQLTDAIVIAEGGTARSRNPRHRPEMTVFAIDLSGSMTAHMEGHKTRIAVVEEALLHLLKYKQACFS
jgi:Mg-chelatase subunit ChlD